MDEIEQFQLSLPHYAVRTETPEGVDEIANGDTLNACMAVAYRHHALTGDKTWVINTRTNETEHRLERESAAGGAI